MSDMHELLPWYVNGTLEPAEAAAFEGHLAACAACRDELALLRRMRDRLGASGDALLSDHPSPRALVDAVWAGAGDAEMTPAEAAQVRRHIEVCVTCAEEARWTAAATRAIPAPAPAVPPVVSGVWRRVLPWGWAVAAVLALVMVRSTLLGPGTDAGPGGIAPLHTIEPTERAGSGTTALVAAPNAGMIHLVFPVDVASGAFPLRFEILDASGRVVYRNPQIRESELSRGSFLFLSLRRADCPDGAYVARLTSEDGRGTATEYPFRLAAESPRGER